MGGKKAMKLQGSRLGAFGANGSPKLNETYETPGKVIWAGARLTLYITLFFYIKFLGVTSD